MKIKMVDVAKRLGISKATVSLAVNGKPGVNEQTRQKVLECIKELEKNNCRTSHGHDASRHRLRKERKNGGGKTPPPLFR